MENKIKRKIIIGLSKEYEIGVKTVYTYYDLIVDHLNKMGFGNICEPEFLLRCLERVLQERSSIILSNSYVKETRNIKEAIVPELGSGVNLFPEDEDTIQFIKYRNTPVIELPLIGDSYDLDYTDDLALTIIKVITEELGIDFDYRQYEDGILTDEEIQRRWFKGNYLYTDVRDDYRKYADDYVEKDDELPVEDNSIYDYHTGNSLSDLAFVENDGSDHFDDDGLYARIAKSKKILKSKLKFSTDSLEIKEQLEKLERLESYIKGEAVCESKWLDYRAICKMLYGINNFADEIGEKNAEELITLGKEPKPKFEPF